MMYIVTELLYGENMNNHRRFQGDERQKGAASLRFEKLLDHPEQTGGGTQKTLPERGKPYSWTSEFCRSEKLTCTADQRWSEAHQWNMRMLVLIEYENSSTRVHPFKGMPVDSNGVVRSIQVTESDYETFIAFGMSALGSD
jgi:hypothetical protein